MGRFAIAYRPNIMKVNECSSLGQLMQWYVHFNQGATSWQLLKQIKLPQQANILTLAVTASNLLNLMTLPTLPTWQSKSSQCRSLPPVRRWAWRCWEGVSRAAVKYVAAVPHSLWGFLSQTLPSPDSFDCGCKNPLYTRSNCQLSLQEPVWAALLKGSLKENSMMQKRRLVHVEHSLENTLHRCPFLAYQQSKFSWLRIMKSV